VQRGWFLENIIDYAGIFPPAALPNEQAYTNYLELLGSKDSWIVGSLAWSATELPNLMKMVGNDEVEIAVIGRGSSDWSSWQEARAQDAETMNQFIEACPNAEISTYESRLTPTSEIETAIKALKKMSDATMIAIELPWGEPLEDALAAIAEAEWPIVKFRTGGTQMEAYPSSEELASAIHQCVDLDLRFKLTAGLHEPLAHVEKTNGAWAHGFLNVVTAVSMAFHEDATIRELTEILNDGDSDNWKLSDTLTWRHHTINKDQLEDVRSFFGSFGSCSVSEPLAGLDLIKN
jgi:hypothetical protein